MKKLAMFTLGGLMVLSVSACGQEQAKNSNTLPTAKSQVILGKDESTWGPDEHIDAKDITLGGWEQTQSPEITNEIKSLVEKASEKLVGATYTPVAYIGSQIVAGTNHLVLCKIETATLNTTESYVLVTIYEDLEGNVDITEVLESSADGAVSNLPSGWQAPESPLVTEEASKVLEKATNKILGASYTPLALLATQVVTGTNYSILCEVAATSPEAESTYSIVTIYEDLDGNAKITETYDFRGSE